MRVKSLISKWPWLILTIFLSMMALVSAVSLRKITNEDLAAGRKSAEQQSRLIASIVTTEMDSGRFDNVGRLFNQLAQANDDILALRLDGANGFNLATYNRAASDIHAFKLTLPIAYSYRGEATFTAHFNLDEAYQHDKELILQVASLEIIFALMLSFLLYMTIQRQNEARRSQHLSNLYKALSEINQAIVRMEKQADIFPLVCRCAVDFGGMCMAWVGLLDEVSGMIVPVVSYGQDTEILNNVVISSKANGVAGDGPVSTALRENRAVIINGYSYEMMKVHPELYDSKYSCNSTAAFPIAKNGKPYAVLQVFNMLEDGFDKEGIALLNEMSRDISFALENFEREKQRFEGENSLKLAASVYAASSEGIMITDPNNRIISVNPAFTSITGYSFEEVLAKEPDILKSGRHDEAFYRDMWQSIESTGKWSGEVWDRRKTGEVYPKWLTIDTMFDVEGAVTRRVALFTDITKRKEAEDKIQHLAFYDSLTHLPNRRLLMDRLQQALVSSVRSSREGALLFIDLDNFKNLNDTLGHDVGDLLLQQVTIRLESCIRDGDTVARLGGDEFVVMLSDLSEHSIEAAAQSESVGEKILATFSQPYQLDKHTFRCTASIGVTLFKGIQQSAEELMKQADIAMYQAKKSGRNALRYFDRQMQESISARVSMESELHNALEFQQFHLYYQIQVDSSSRPLGAEALIRWIHPSRGIVSPMLFIPLAEETGLIFPIGRWVIETACAQIKKWQQDAATRNLVMAINVSAKQFRQTDFVAQVQAAIQRHTIPAHLLKLELTESLLQEDIEATIVTMNALNELGIQFSLDDFGTGFSSLQYLKRLPLDQLKIDQSFVRDIATDGSDKAIVQTIISMANSLKLDVIAEGVETEEQRQLLMDYGCTHFQGYLFSKPVPIEEFDVLLKRVD